MNFNQPRRLGECHSYLWDFKAYFSDCFLKCNSCHVQFISIDEFNGHLSNCHQTNNVQFDKYCKINRVEPVQIHTDVRHKDKKFRKDRLIEQCTLCGDAFKKKVYSKHVTNCKGRFCCNCKHFYAARGKKCHSFMTWF